MKVNKIQKQVRQTKKLDIVLVENADKMDIRNT